MSAAQTHIAHEMHLSRHQDVVKIIWIIDNGDYIILTTRFCATSPITLVGLCATWTWTKRRSVAPTRERASPLFVHGPGIRFGIAVEEWTWTFRGGSTGDAVEKINPVRGIKRVKLVTTKGYTRVNERRKTSTKARNECNAKQRIYRRTSVDRSRRCCGCSCRCFIHATYIEQWWWSCWWWWWLCAHVITALSQRYQWDVTEACSQTKYSSLNGNPTTARHFATRSPLTRRLWMRVRQSLVDNKYCIVIQFSKKVRRKNNYVVKNYHHLFQVQMP